MEKGDRIYTPRFCSVIFDEIFETNDEARNNGYIEPTYYMSSDYEIFGKVTSLNHMVFAAVKK